MDLEYEFPVIANIDQIYDAIDGYEEFIVKKDYVNELLIVNYVFSMPQSFLPPVDVESEEENLKAQLRRECRGIEFDMNTGNLVTRKYHKFFNVDQVKETQSGVIDWSRPHKILDKLDGCLPAHTEIEFCDGSKHTISKIVKNKLIGPIWGVDTSGNVVETQITNWANYGLATNWKSMTISDGFHLRTLECTENHKIKIGCDWVQAGNAKVGDALFRKEKRFNSVQKSMLIGSLLGDMCIVKSARTYNLQYGSKLEHKSYDDLKTFILKPNHTSQRYCNSGYGTNMLSCRTAAASAIRYLEDDISYRSVLSRKWLDQLDEISLAFWYMDDGSMSHGIHQQRPRAMLHTESYTESEIDVIIEYFKERWNLVVVKNRYVRNNKEVISLRFNADEAVKFWNLIAQYVIDVMKYKLPEQYSNVSCFWDEYSPARDFYGMNGNWKITEICSGLKSHAGANRGVRYDIETETHNFFANGFLVHNSMITGFLRKDGTVQYHTKMGATDVATPINLFVKDSDVPYNDFFLDCRDAGITAIFEWCSRQQKIVVDYPKEQLILTGLRHNRTGTYVPYDQMRLCAEAKGIPVVHAHDSKVDDVRVFLQTISTLKGAEGVVVRFDSGHMCKVKADEYMTLHNSIDLVKFEKDVVALLLNDALDDLLPKMVESTRIPIEKFSKDFHQNLKEYAAKLDKLTKHNKSWSHGDRKVFALEYAPSLDKPDVGMIFKIWDGANSLETLKKYLRKHTGSSTEIETIRKYFKVKWMDYYNAPETED